MEPALRRIVWQRADSRCEYCQMPQALDVAAFEIDHIVAKKHGGATDANNLALSCFYCNSFKGSDIGSLAPETQRLTRLYNPRRQRWATHFRWDGVYLVGRTPVGRVTVSLLHINDDYRVRLRQHLVDEGVLILQ